MLKRRAGAPARRRAGRPLRPPRLCASARLRVCASTLACAALAACASAGDPPGGAPDEQPPTIVRFAPDSGTVLTVPPNEASIYFDEVISERVTGQPPDITSAVLLSPTQGEVRVSWHRDRISVRPRSGFLPGRVYRLEVLPVITDLRTNRLRTGRTIVFSTGPAIPEAVLEGSLVDWVAGKQAIRALIEAVLLPDSLTYRALTDSAGYFRLAQMPAGRYLIRGVMDSNNDRRLGGREAYDTLSVNADSGAGIELYAFVHDTIGPRLRQVELVDSVTLRLTFDRPLDPQRAIDTAAVSVATLEDSTTRLPLLGVYTQQALEAFQKHQTDSVAAARARADSIAAAADTTRRRPAADSARPGAGAPRGLPVRPPARPSAPVPGRPAAPRPIRPGLGGAPLDSTRAERMLARRPAPTEVRLVRLAAPLAPDTRYVIYVAGALSLSGNESNARGQLRTPRPKERPAGRVGPATDSTARDSTARDSTAAPRDSLIAAPDSARPARPVPARP